MGMPLPTATVLALLEFSTTENRRVGSAAVPPMTRKGKGVTAVLSGSTVSFWAGRVPAGVAVSAVVIEGNTWFATTATCWFTASDWKGEVLAEILTVMAATSAE